MFSLLTTTPVEFQRRVHQALKCWHDNHPKHGLLSDLLIAEQVTGCRPLTRRQSTNLLLEQGLVRLAAFDPSDADLLRLRFFSGLHVREVQQSIHYSASMVYVKQGRAIAHLSSILYQWEAAARQDGSLAGENNWAERETLPSGFRNF